MKNKQEVGPFFVILNNVYGWGKEIDNVIPTKDGIYDSSLTHFEYFDELVEDLDELQLSKFDDYGEFPRGRVIYFRQQNIFVIYADKCILKNNNLKEQILKEFSLSNCNVEWRYDDHYTCANCDEEIRNNLFIINNYTNC